MTRLAAAALALVGLLASAEPNAQISFRGAASATAPNITPIFRGATSAATRTVSLSIARPTGTSANDVLIASIAVRPSSAAITPPDGWTLVRRLDNANSSSNSLAVFYKVALSSEPASYAWNVAGASFSVGGVQRFSGIDTASPLAAESGQNTPSGTTHAAPAIATPVGNSMLVSSHAFASSQTWDPPSGMIESFDRRSGDIGSAGISIQGSRVIQPVAGPTGTKVASADGSADVGNAHLLALRPASANLSIATPAGTAPGDVLIAAIAFNNSNASATAPAGWTFVRRIDNAARTSNSLAVYRKNATASEPASHVWRVAGGLFIVGGIQSFSGVDNANPIDAEGGQNTPSGTSHDTPSITPGAANAMLVTAHTYAAAQNWTAEAGLTEAFERTSGLSLIGQSITGAYQLQPTAGPTGAKRSTAANNADVGNTHILALRPVVPNVPPSVSIVNPPHGAVIGSLAGITLTASASDADGAIQKVEFFHGGTNLIATATQPPYTVSWSPAAFGSYTITAVATDDRNATATSWPITVNVVNPPPTVGLTSPSPGATFSAPANIVITANATDLEGSIQKVDFFHGGTNLIATLTAAPYSFTWTGVPQGAYSLTAVATDNQNVSTTSAPVTVTVNNEAALHFVHVDHLNTPRLVADAAGATVWKWNQQEPFGNNVADANPSALSVFDLPLRLPGQYYDKETNLHHNYFRDYDASIGRYVESDPIGLQGGIDTYTYGIANPLGNIDMNGLEVTVMCRLLDSPGVRLSDAIYGQPQKHCFVYVSCPDEGWAHVLSLFGNAPFFQSGYKSKATPLRPAGGDDPNSGAITNSVLITPTSNNCPACAFEKHVLRRFDSLPAKLPYSLFFMNSNAFAASLVTSPAFGTSLPPGAIANAPTIAAQYVVPTPITVRYRQ